MKTWMRNGLTYVLAFLCLFAGMQWTVRAKNQAVGSAYRTAQETLRATELTQYITSLEFGIRYGKNLEKYFNMDEVLESILRTSPYVEGAYILSNENVLLYSAGEALPNPEEIRVLHNGDALYASSEQFGYAIMFMDIEDASGGRAGTLMILLNDDIMTRLIETYQSEGRAQSWVILGEVLLLFILVHTRLTKAGKRRLSALALAILLAVSVLFAQGLDIGIETAKLSVELETITSQSVQKIAQVLQQQVESVMDKGVSVNDLYDIYGWLDDIDSTLDMVARLDFTEEGRVRAVMDTEYLTARLRTAFGEMAGQYGLLAGACALLCVLVAFAPKFLGRWSRRGRGRTLGGKPADREVNGYAAG